ncbi:MAG: DUF1330 domain-containing protein [Alphaproteobacteria bacterium]|nr:DUF1330 domain-containing protein [Alphaproteobacteria bacterium]
MAGAFANAVYPGPEQIADMQKPGPGGPIVMVNLLKFREKAQYADGRKSDLTGRAAYQIYGRAVTKLVEKHGGKVLYAGDVSFLALGACEPLWDEVALAQYPSRKALWEMSISPEWREIAVHREAGLEGQLNIETTPTFIAGAL